MTELIFSVKNIFARESKDDCLVQYGAEKYYIPAYQRGYKWDSDKNGAVNILLKDIFDAFNAFRRNERKEYYLQYITVKKNLRERHLEVIDGQQRLTTMSIILSVFANILHKDNPALNKLDYAIRTNFFSQYIYDKRNLETLVASEWVRENGVQLDGKYYNSQDIYYVWRAVQRIHDFISEIEVDAHEELYEYILENIKIIVNAVDSHVSGEKVFSNLNSNKVPLTETELIKGLLITKISRKNQKEESPKHFREILEIRTSLGRYWDELASWCNSAEIKSFYFGKGSGMENLLNVCALSLETSGNKIDHTAAPKDYPLFNFYHKLGYVEDVYDRLKNFHSLLKEWFYDDELHNLFGFIFFAEGSKIHKSEFLDQCRKKNKVELRAYLVGKVNNLIPKDIEKLFYNDKRNEEIHRVLLALSVFGHGKTIRFNFYDFIEEHWTLEHIFPQSPEGKNHILTPREKEQILEMLGEKASPEIQIVLGLDERSDEQKEIYYRALKDIGGLNSIGNMCLLTGGDNSSNGCKMFGEKRDNILLLIRQGSFVPKHTFDVFSKMIFPNEPGDLSIWDKRNIDQHIVQMNTLIQNLNII